jgi:hypothetical protein
MARQYIGSSHPKLLPIPSNKYNFEEISPLTKANNYTDRNVDGNIFFIDQSRPWQLQSQRPANVAGTPTPIPTPSTIFSLSKIQIIRRCFKVNRSLQMVVYLQPNLKHLSSCYLLWQLAEWLLVETISVRVSRRRGE